MKDTTMAGDRAGLLVRVSSGGQDEANQVPDVERHAETRGYRVCERYVLHDKSAYKGEQQAALDQVIADMRAGNIKVLICWHSDRLDRRGVLESLLFLRAVKEAGGRVESSQEGLLDENSLTTIVTGFTNHQKSEHLSHQVSLAHKRIMENRAFRGRDPFGYEITGPKYDRKLTVIEELRPIVTEIFDRVIAGESLGDLCIWLDSLKCKRSKTTTRKYQAGEVTPWWLAMLMRLVKHPAYSGTYWVEYTEDEKTVRYAHKCEGIVRPSVQREAIRALSTREKRGPRGNPENRAMLKGAITCPDCDDSPMYKIMVRRTSRKGHEHERTAYYRCAGRGPNRQGCGNMVRAEVADEAIDKIFAETFNEPVTVRVRIKGHDWSDEIDAVKDEISALGAEDLDDEEYDRRLATLRAERDRLKALPAEPDEIREQQTDDYWSDLYEALERCDRGAWLVSHGFHVTASKRAVTLTRGARSATVRL